MTSTDIYKKALSSGIFIALMAAILALLSIFEANISAFFDSMSMSETMYLHITKIVRTVVLMLIVIAAVRFFAFLIMRAAVRRATTSEVSSLLRTVFSIVVYIIAFLIIFESQFPDVSLAPLFTGSTILGIVVGLAVQDTLGNLFAGIAMQADQPFQVGDVVAITNRGAGVVESVSWRGVKIRTFQNKLLIVSNAVLGKEIIEVAPKHNLNARIIYFSTEYHYSPAHTQHVVREAIRHAENVSQKMRPIVRILLLGDEGLNWEVKYWLEDYAKYNDTDALVRQRIWYAFQREKIVFSHPSRIIRMESKAEEAAPEELFETIAERLNSVTIFEPLSDEEIEVLANSSTSKLYAPGEMIVRKGQEGGSMFVVINGEVKVQIPEQGYQKTVGNLYENDFFGEMSLLTGEPRSANVIAVGETEVLRIDKNGLKPILENNPQLVESICMMVEERKMLLNAGPMPNEDETTEKRKGVMLSIRSFFGLK